ncbi:hypothetical protein FIU87_08625 [Bacillus sp. THAF10]|nr:hypothetical protein FIU87_08625 [Bacillus sp. THAF10]
MIRGSVVFFTLSFFILSSCQENESITHMEIPEDSHTLLFFSGETNDHDESTYYDAIIDVKSSESDDLENIEFVHSEGNKILYKQFNVTSTPTIVVVHQNKILTQIDGPQSKENIVVSIEEALNKADGSAYK